ncbi:CopG family transcriptional regulator [Gloeocapsopsis crepidinum LEGE 06123]|uniref:CopG family transcriptional regulator n=1 Tax=Gloeocapsopsis crepidinum LEGE 06123 TaxID=588587 RepID=A0ABR9USX8_9CHRO|nr:CopG family antitoxin [Gloeocapsopsis crepidinum]MBE9191392.1 CopG family transcriptional regulator [Gloeocapsopsis crepidinum LEGE 06123]
MKASEFDEKFDSGEDVTEFLELSKALRPAYSLKRVNVDFPAWMIDALDQEAQRLGVTRQSLIKMWLAERLEFNHAAKHKSDRISN